MDMQIFFTGVGASLGGLGANAGKRAKITFRDRGATEGVMFTITNNFSVGGDTTMIGFTHLATQWVPINLSRNTWLFDLDTLVGHIGEARLEGGSLGALGATYVDTKLTVFNNHHQPVHSLKAHNVPVIDNSINTNTFTVAGRIQHPETVDIRTFEKDGDAVVLPAVDGLDELVQCNRP